STGRWSTSHKFMILSAGYSFPETMPRRHKRKLIAWILSIQMVMRPSPPLLAGKDADAETELLTQGNHFAEDVSVTDGDVVAHVMGHDRFHGAAQVGSHERPLPGRAVPPLIADLRRQLNDLATADVHPQLLVLDVTAGPCHVTGQAFAGKRSARNGEIACGLAVRMDPL